MNIHFEKFLMSMLFATGIAFFYLIVKNRLTKSFLFPLFIGSVIFFMLKFEQVIPDIITLEFQLGFCVVFMAVVSMQLLHMCNINVSWIVGVVGAVIAYVIALRVLYFMYGLVEAPNTLLPELGWDGVDWSKTNWTSNVVDNLNIVGCLFLCGAFFLEYRFNKRGDE